MTPQDLKSRFDALAKQMLTNRAALHELSVHLTRPDDQHALQSMLTDLAWAAENCAVIGLHQIGQALSDNMGTPKSP